MGTHDFKYNNVPIFARKSGNINTSMSATPKLALVPASHYFCDVTWSHHNVQLYVPIFIQIERGSDGDP